MTRLSNMKAVRLHGPSDLRVEQLPFPTQPGPGQVLLKVKCTGVCGSDLHTFKHGKIGNVEVKNPLVLGHEFSGLVEDIGPDSLDGNFHRLERGTRVTVDPAQPCWQCEFCEQGHPNLCERLHFCGSYPDDGSLRQWMIMPARCCFPIPDSLAFDEATMLEPLGVALHTVDLAHIRIGDSVAILGAGTIGLLILQTAKLAGADPIYISDKFDWRLELAKKYGAIPINCDSQDQVKKVLETTGGRGVDVAIEAAWADESVQLAAEITRLGGRLVITGISGDDNLLFNHSEVRRKGLTIRMCRRMKHTYPRALKLVENGAVDVKSLITHHFPMEKTVEAYQLSANYDDGVIKAIVEQ